MANPRIKITGETKVDRAINGTIRQLKRLGGTVKKISAGFKKLTGGMVRGLRSASIAIGATVAASALLVKAYTKQQDAEGRLVDSLNMTGDATDANIAKFKEFAAGIQKVTVHGDEAVMEMVALAKAMGIGTEHLEDATKAAIGLAASYKIDVTSAMKLVAKANAGQTGELSRYGIVLDQSLSKQEKFTALLMKGKAAFTFAEKEAGRLGGRFTQLKNSIGDLAEDFGEFIVKAFKLEDRFLAMRDALDKFIAKMDKDDSIQKWADAAADKLAVVGATIKGLFSGEQRMLVFKALGGVIVAAFKQASTAAVDIIKDAAPAIGDMIAQGFNDAIVGRKGVIKGPMEMKQGAGFNARGAKPDPVHNALDIAVNNLRRVVGATAKKGGVALALPTPATASAEVATGAQSSPAHAVSPGQASEAIDAIKGRITGIFAGLVQVNKMAFGGAAKKTAEHMKRFAGFGKVDQREIMRTRLNRMRGNMGGIRGMGAGGSKTLGGGFTNLGGLTRLEDGTGIKDAIKASRTVVKGQLGTLNNPMVVKLNEEPV